MNKEDVVRNLQSLSEMLCIPIEEAWEKHTDEMTKQICSIEKLKELIGKD